jgi:hypothetical protein
MMRDWKPVLQVIRGQMLLLVTSETGDVLKARLPLSPSHPRALLTLLEGLALWSGEPLTVAVSAAESSPDWLGSGLFGDEFFPGESQLVRFHVGRLDCRVQRLRGVADFRHLRRGGT